MSNYLSNVMTSLESDKAMTMVEVWVLFKSMRDGMEMPKGVRKRERKDANKVT